MSWIRWLKSKKVISATPQESVAAAAQRMSEHRIGALLVVDEGDLVGIFTERDVVKRVVAVGKDPRVTPIGDVCSKDVATVSEEADPATCAKLIRDRGFRHLPVVDENGSPVGILSARDFLQHIADELEDLLGSSYGRQRAEEQSDPFDS
jgi:CBS domain-containing protein